MKRFHLIALMRSLSGTAAAEMALVAPMLITLMFGAFELGNYFLSEHVVVKAVRDAARFAARQPFDTYYDFDSDTCRSETDAEFVAVADTVDLLTRTGQIADQDAPTRLPNWASASSVNVTLSCAPIATYSGIYKDMDYIPVVTVSVTGLTYSSLFNNIGLTSSTLTLNAESEATVMGI